MPPGKGTAGMWPRDMSTYVKICQKTFWDFLDILVIQPRYPVLGVGGGGIETRMSAGPPCVQGVRHFPLYVDAW